jgi:protein TonB
VTAARGYPRPPSAVRPTLGAIGLAAALTVATISVLPLFGMLSARMSADTDLRTAPEVTYVPPPDRPPESSRREAEPDPERRPALSRAVRPAASVPEISAPRIVTALPATDLVIGLGDLDPALGFEVARPAVPAPPVAPPPPRVERAPVLLATEPVLLHREEPGYPEQALLSGVEGFVKLLIRVAEDGTVAEIRVEASAPGRTFVAVSQRAVKRWRFKPATRGGRPVPAWVEQTITFTLRGGR